MFSARTRFTRNFCRAVLTPKASESMTVFGPLEERPNLAGEENIIVDKWKKEKIFEKTLEESLAEKRPLYTFYDGPPFATGLPHYGHLLSGTIKDVVTRYAQQTGHHVERRFGWDCHGLPVEYEVNKMLNLSHRQDVLDMGIPKYNAECRSIVMRYSSEWKAIVERMGRWIDFDNDYKTLDLSFMESVWWVFKTVFDKGLVYRAFKVMPFSTACNTPLSNFEANQNYKDVSDPSLVLKFTSVDDPEVAFLAWTTTPWTLPSNLALCAHPTLQYVKVKVHSLNSQWVLCESRLPWLCKELKLDMATDVKILDKFPGSALEGKKYKPLFPYFNCLENSAFRILVDGYVSDDAGTGLVHCAPAFGEDDYRICTLHKVVPENEPLPCPVDDNGMFTSEVADFVGQHVKAADKAIKIHLKEQDKLLLSGEIVHSYPFCWRSDTPLIYKAVPCWFVKVECLKDKLIANNNLSYWVPTFVQEKRFHNWLSDARDWCISRNRFWGTPIPLWVSEDFSQIKCLGSIEELEKYAGRKITDLHRDFIDDIEVPDPRGPSYPNLKRVDEVFDCWFESGSMPYAQIHYPFENKDKFANGFPADFIAEGLDQTRGWFYTLIVLSTALFDKPPFKNLIVNGLVLAADGKKMSKRLNNYPSPSTVIDKYGADALRLYLISSPVVRAESLRFREDGVKDVVKDVLLPWYHACRFFIQEATRYETNGGKPFVPDLPTVQKSTNFMDHWVLSTTQSLLQYVRECMGAYKLYLVLPRLLEFLDSLTNWYVRFNRDRMRGVVSVEESRVSLRTLYEVLLNTCIIMSPFAPFMSEVLYQALRPAQDAARDPARTRHSVHLLQIPQPDKHSIDERTEIRMKRMQSVITMGRALRERRKIATKTPIRSLTVIAPDQEYVDDIVAVQGYIRDELNTIEVDANADQTKVRLSATPHFKNLGVRLGSNMKAVHEAVRKMTHDDCENFKVEGSIKVCGGTIELGIEDLVLKRESAQQTTGHMGTDGDKEVLIVMDFTPEEGLLQLAVAREIANRIQKLRKKFNYQASDDVQMWAGSDNPEMQAILSTRSEYINKVLRRKLHKVSPTDTPKEQSIDNREDVEVNGLGLTVMFVRVN